MNTNRTRLRASHLLFAVPVFTALAVTPGCAPTPAPSPDPLGRAEAATLVSVDPTQELVITNKNVVEDFSRAIEPCAATQPGNYPTGTYPWSFGYLMTQILEGQGVTSPSAVSNAVLGLFQMWEKTLNLVNPMGMTTPVAARPLIDTYIINPWLANTSAFGDPANGPIDLNLAPFRLLAIVNRFDQRTSGNAGGARFVFGAVYNTTPAGGPQTCVTLPFTFIVEYSQPASTPGQLTATADAWHGLNGLTPQTAYNSALQTITDGFSKSAGAGSLTPVLTSLRTNEIALAPTLGFWELRELNLTSQDGGTGTCGGAPQCLFSLVPTTQSPDISQNNTSALTSVMQQYNCVSDQVPMEEIQGSYAPNFPTLWNAANVTAAQRENFALNATCNGCHDAETGTFGFTHIVPRDQGSPSALSAFMTGCGTVGTGYCSTGSTTVLDPVNPGTAAPYLTYAFNEMQRRASYFSQFLTYGTNPPGGSCITP